MNGVLSLYTGSKTSSDMQADRMATRTLSMLLPQPPKAQAQSTNVMLAAAKNMRAEGQGPATIGPGQEEDVAGKAAGGEGGDGRQGKVTGRKHGKHGQYVGNQGIIVQDSPLQVSGSIMS